MKIKEKFQRFNKKVFLITVIPFLIIATVGVQFIDGLVVYLFLGILVSLHSAVYQKYKDRE
ncbi:hypothetical protein [Isachenkonia alkalipeptolytica]|uniref:Uncharacterized protein n=1 Tax=Isachenkonia alkalipeptolytica TaxID=2565777 RepID=A0AA44BCW3_9CLOT|nr:hypothetical protein [Isachenkonia alkalipeptolytica]NBG87328.1 hypothetical protein [Isachenkonia alkalipeptolytica]